MGPRLANLVPWKMMFSAVTLAASSRQSQVATFCSCLFWLAQSWLWQTWQSSGIIHPIMSVDLRFGPCGKQICYNARGRWRKVMRVSFGTVLAACCKLIVMMFVQNWWSKRDYFAHFSSCCSVVRHDARTTEIGSLIQAVEFCTKINTIF